MLRTRLKQGACQAPAGLVSHASLGGDEVRLDPANFVARERKDVAEDEPREFTTLVGGLAVTDRNHGLGLFDEAIDDQRRATHEVVVLDLLIERVLAREMGVSGEVPDDDVGQAGEDPFVIAPAEPLDLRFDDLFACFAWWHIAFSVSARGTGLFRTRRGRPALGGPVELVPLPATFAWWPGGRWAGVANPCARGCRTREGVDPL